MRLAKRIKKLPLRSKVIFAAFIAVVIISSLYLILNGLFNNVTSSASTLSSINNQANAFFKDLSGGNFTSSSNIITNPISTPISPPVSPSPTLSPSPLVSPTPTPSPSPTPSDSVVISNVSISAAASSATITWTTNVPSTSQVKYGINNTGENSTSVDSNLVTEHRAILTGLKRNKWYIYEIISTVSGYRDARTFGNFRTKNR